MDKSEKIQKIGEFILDIAKIIFAGFVLLKVPQGVTGNDFVLGVVFFAVSTVVGFILVFLKGGKK